MKPEMMMEDARLNEWGDVELLISGHRFWAGEKYSILESGWAVYCTSEDLPEEWLMKYAETRPRDENWNEFESTKSRLITSHPVLVALALQACWHRNDKPIATAPFVEIPSFEQAVEIVRGRKIINDFNNCYAGTVPGLMRWGS